VAHHNNVCTTLQVNPLGDRMSNKKILEALEEEIESRSKQLASSDPTIAYLRGALDFANGNIQLKEGEEDGIKKPAVVGNIVENTKS